MKNVDRLFVLTGLVFLLIGMAFGLKMSATMDFTLHGLHAHLNLLGFVLMTLFGLCYRAWPKMQEGKLATVHYFLHTVCVASALALLYFYALYVCVNKKKNLLLLLTKSLPGRILIIFLVDVLLPSKVDQTVLCIVLVFATLFRLHFDLLRLSKEGA